MYGVPLTIFLLSGWLGSQFPELLPTHAGGHLWNDLIGWTGDPHLSPFHYVGIAAGFWLVEREVRKRSGVEWDACAAATRRFLPRLVRRTALPGST